MWAQQQMESAVWSLNLKSLPTLFSLFLRSSYDKIFGSDGVIHLVGDFLPSCQEYRETWERTEWGGSRRNGERALQNCSCKQSIERNWTLMTVMSCSEILCLFCRVLFYLCLKGYATGWGHGILRSSNPDIYRKRVQAQVFMQRQHLICITLL